MNGTSDNRHSRFALLTPAGGPFLAALLLSLAGCASKEWIAQEASSGLSPLLPEYTATLRQEADAWQASHQLVTDAAREHARQIETVTAQFRRTNAEANQVNASAVKAQQDFDGKEALIAREITEIYSKADAPLQEGVSLEAKTRRENDLTAWRQRCQAIDQQVIGLEAKRKEELPWSALALLPAQRAFYDGRPSEVRDLLALGTADLVAREAQESEPQAIFLVRAAMNYRAALEELAPDARRLIQTWQPAWNAEKALLRASDNASAAPAQGAQQEALRVALTNKAYACDALLRTRGAQAGYDLVEIAYYINEIAYCAERLGPPFSDTLAPLVALYTERLNNRAPMIGVNPVIEEIADSITISAGVNTPVIQNRPAATRVSTQNRQATFTGGLTQDQKTDSVSKVPLLGDIPFFGSLFRQTTTAKQPM